mmetsp:Transcript_15573/g.25236  ORF Transcript_15573/g.25236 Transcript_15573/m.25236 type:complete len:148 (+) Transcript_15573:156-599(+)
MSAAWKSLFLPKESPTQRNESESHFWNMQTKRMPFLRLGGQPLPRVQDLSQENDSEGLEEGTVVWAMVFLLLVSRNLCLGYQRATGTIGKLSHTITVAVIMCFLSILLHRQMQLVPSGPCHTYKCIRGLLDLQMKTFKCIYQIKLMH